MELKSTYFTTLISNLASSNQLIATIPVKKIPLTEELILKYECDVMHLTKSTREVVWEQMCAWIDKNYEA